MPILVARVEQTYLATTAIEFLEAVHVTPRPMHVNRFVEVIVYSAEHSYSRVALERLPKLLTPYAKAQRSDQGRCTGTDIDVEISAPAQIIPDAIGSVAIVRRVTCEGSHYQLGSEEVQAV